MPDPTSTALAEAIEALEFYRDAWTFWQDGDESGVTDQGLDPRSDLLADMGRKAHDALARLRTQAEAPPTDDPVQDAEPAAADLTASASEPAGRTGGAHPPTGAITPKPAGLKFDWRANGVDERFARLWLEHGGSHHGPRVEHVSMPMSKFQAFAEALASRPSTPAEAPDGVLRERVARTLYAQEKARSAGGAMEPFEECAETTWYLDADAILALLPPADGAEAGLGELRKLSEKASPGFLRAIKDRRRYLPWRVENEEGTAHVADFNQATRGDFPEIEANAQFTAACWNYVRALLAAQQGGRNG